MEFLDPAAKKARTIRLFVGYALLAIVVALATTILVYQAQGFGYDRDKGVVQNSLLFVDAKPASARITLDGNTLNSNTNARVTISEGTHTIKLSIDKYRDWTKQFSVEGGAVKYLLYPRLFPKDIPLGITRILPQSPAWASQSLDRRWFVYQPVVTLPEILVTDLTKSTETPLTTTLPSTVLQSENGQYGTIKPLEWSDDNKHLLLQQSLPSGAVVYIIFDREDATQSLNVTKNLKLTADQTVTLRDKKYDKFYVFSATKGELRTASIKTGEVSAPIANGVVAYKTHGNDIVYYVTYIGAKPTEANLVVMTDQKNLYSLRPITRDPSNTYLLDVAKFDGNWIYVAGAPSNEFVRVYRNPLSRIKANGATQASPQMSMRIQNPQFVSFSDNTRFVAVQSGKQFVVYDAEEARMFRYEMQLNIPQAQKADWMDGHRLTVNSDGRVFVYDFDGTNVQNLVASKPEFGAYFDRDYKYLYTLITQADSKTGFQNAQLILN